MKSFKYIIRGGQLSLHAYHMIKQVLVVAFLLSVFCGIGIFATLTYQNTTPYDRYLYRQLLYAEFNMASHFSAPHKAIQRFENPHGHLTDISSQALFVNTFSQQFLEAFYKKTLEWFHQSTLYGCLIFFGFLGLFGLSGHLKSRKKLERGGQILEASDLARLIKRRRQASDLTLDGLPLLKDRETSHILITGTTGAGKTNCLNTLIPQIRARGDRALIVDLTGHFVSTYFDEQTDHILNPLDARTEDWLPWADCQNEPHYDALATALIPPQQSHDSFWENASRVVLSCALQKLDSHNIEDLYNLLVQEDMLVFSKFFRGTKASSYTHIDGEKMTLSIRATLSNQIQGLRLLKQTPKPFSIREWVTAPDQGWLFISARPDQRDTLRPLMSTWLDIASNALMTRPEGEGQKIWLIIDELPALQKVHSLKTLLAEARKYQACVMAGFQSTSQLHSIYGQNDAQTLLDLFNTKIFFRNTDPTTNAWISKVIGEADITEYVENLSYGANTIRDGVSLSHQNKTKPLILPTEIAHLENLEAIITLPGALPAGRLKMTYKQMQRGAAAFVDVATENT